MSFDRVGMVLLRLHKQVTVTISIFRGTLLICIVIPMIRCGWPSSAAGKPNIRQQCRFCHESWMTLLNESEFQFLLFGFAITEECGMFTLVHSVRNVESARRRGVAGTWGFVNKNSHSPCHYVTRIRTILCGMYSDYGCFILYIYDSLKGCPRGHSFLCSVQSETGPRQALVI